MGVRLPAALWGFAEATFFFVVPDVWLTIVGRDNLRIGLIASLFALLGALSGGVLMYVWGVQAYHEATMLLLQVPAIDTAMLQRVQAELQQQGMWAILLGPLSGTPYKTYAVQAAGNGVDLWPFVLVSIPARLIRFVLVTSVAHVLLQWVGRRFKQVNTLYLLLIGWLVFYLFYFSHRGLA